MDKNMYTNFKYCHLSQKEFHMTKWYDKVIQACLM